MPGMIGLGFVVGLLMGLTGAGGGVLAVPGLMLVMDWTVVQAAPLAMLSVAISAGVGAIDGLRRKLARYRAAMLMALAALPFSSLGIHLAQEFPPRLLAGVFAVILLYIAVRQMQGCLAGGASAEGNDAALCHMDWHTGRLAWNRRTAVLIGGVGAITGFLTGLLGVGGAFFMVPMLRRLTDIPLQGVIATVLLTMALVASGSLVLVGFHGVPVPMALAVPFVLAAIAGMVAGRRLVRRLSPRALQCSFGALVAGVGVIVALRTAGVL